MRSLLRTRRWIAFTLLVVVAIAGFGLLSRWQWERAEEERQERVSQDQASARDLRDLDVVLAAPSEWAPVRLTGVFDADSTTLIRQRPLEGRNGFWVASALTSTSGRVWVVRGWIPSTGTAAGVVEAPAPPTGSVTIDGRLRWAETLGAPAPTDLPPGQASRLDPVALGADVTAVYVEVERMSPSDSGLTPLPAPVFDETQNISYAVQWMIFAVIALIGWWFFLRREAREDARHGSTANPSQSSNWVA